MEVLIGVDVSEGVGWWVLSICAGVGGGLRGVELGVVIVVRIERVDASKLENIFSQKTHAIKLLMEVTILVYSHKNLMLHKLYCNMYYRLYYRS